MAMHLNGSVKWIMSVVAGMILLAATAYVSHTEAISRDHEGRISQAETKIAVNNDRFSRIEKQLDRIEAKLDEK